MASQVRYLALLSAALGDVLVKRQPAAALERLARYGDDPFSAELDRHGVAVAPSVCAVAIHGVVPRSPALAVVPQCAARGARPRELARQLVHIHVAPIANQKALLGVEHAQAKGHVVDRRIELEV